MAVLPKSTRAELSCVELSRAELSTAWDGFRSVMWYFPAGARGITGSTGWAWPGAYARKFFCALHVSCAMDQINETSRWIYAPEMLWVPLAQSISGPSNGAPRPGRGEEGRQSSPAQPGKKKRKKVDRCGCRFCADCALPPKPRRRYLLRAPPTTSPNPRNFVFPPFFSTHPSPKNPNPRSLIHHLNLHPAIH